MKNSIKLSDFSFQFSGHGHYKVTYKSTTTSKCWTATTSDMKLIDATKNSDEPKIKDLNELKKMCKSN
jgi:hypothetical protein